MTDFLTHLAQRALGQARVVQPVVRPMYAPTDLTATPGDEGWSEIAVERELPRQRRPVPAPEQRSRHQSPVATAPPGPRVDSHDEVAFVRQRADIPPADPPASAPKRAMPPDPMPHPPEQTTTTAGTAQQNTTQVTNGESPPPQRPRVPLALRQMERAVAAVPLAGSQRPVSPHADDSATDGPSPQPNRPSEAPFTPAIAPPTAGRPSPSSPHASFAAPSPAPTIRVTIGRVEVRAAATPHAPSPARPRRPALSLGDYLKARDGGGR